MVKLVQKLLGEHPKTFKLRHVAVPGPDLPMEKIVTTISGMAPNAVLKKILSKNINVCQTGNVVKNKSQFGLNKNQNLTRN